jgi:signal transduction histidine kinase
MMLRLAEDHERIAEGLNDLVVRRLFSAGLALEAALGLIGEHRAAGKIEHAISELDQAIADLRATVFDAPAADPPGAGSAG